MTSPCKLVFSLLFLPSAVYIGSRVSECLWQKYVEIILVFSHRTFHIKCGNHKTVRLENEKYPYRQLIRFAGYGLVVLAKTPRQPRYFCPFLCGIISKRHIKKQIHRLVFSPLGVFYQTNKIMEAFPLLKFSKLT